MQRRGWVSIVALVACAAPALAQNHGVSAFGLDCPGPLRRGETVHCELAVCHDDDFGDTLLLLEAWAIIDPQGAAIRVPEVGNLPISQVSGNTDALPGASLPRVFGPPLSELGGLPGFPGNGYIWALVDGYVIGPDDPDPLPVAFHFLVQDLCDAPGTDGCFSLPGELSFTVDIEIVCNADTNGDDVVDVNDINNVILDWGGDGGPHGGDVDGSGVVDCEDLISVLAGWGGC